VEFKIKDFRPTLFSITVNGDMGHLPALSAQLRYSNLTTTHRSYFRMRQGVAGKQLRDSWRASAEIPHECPLLKKGSRRVIDDGRLGGITKLPSQMV
jgi:hypothetical protein